ncbi:group I intron-associated PD-(D/E)XK endonuclease [Roseicella sp. DB1501]|uniref:group I intron-associated PD-(D/E)XK endonuclease n=1 Tax=Roseicella sp. DB1501 TaxID=2730925 RepID=UPI0014924B58|nr:hypothetical protein [Roseicella sp. DB1501]
MKTTQRGLMSELAVQRRLIELGAAVLVPVGHDHSFDMVAHWEGRYSRIQVKTARIGLFHGKPNGTIVVPGYSMVGRGKRVKQLSNTDCDVIVAHYPAGERFYAVPPGIGMMSLRYEPTRNGNSKLIRWATDYELVRIEQVLG